MSIERRFAQAVQAVLARYDAFNPVAATFAGLHEHDSELDDLSAQGRSRYATWLRQAVRELESDFGEPGVLPGESDPAMAGTDRPRLDFEVLRSALEAALVTSAEEERHRVDPDMYHSLASNGVFPLLLRSFAPAPERLRAAIARMRQVPTLMDAARQNLDNPPELATRVAMAQADGSVAFFRDTFAQFVEASGADAELAREADEVRRTTLRALEDYRSFLQNELLPRSRGDYHLGRERFIRRLRATEGVTEPPEELRERAEREIERLRGEVDRVARRLAPHQSPGITISELSARHPTAAELVSAYRGRQQELRRFLRERDLVTFPSEWDVLELIETPPFVRSMVVAACDPPGAFEPVDRTTYFWVTPVDPTASLQAQEQYLRGHSSEGIDMISIHEAYPGHHLQGLHARQSPSRVRRRFWSGTFGEGWAHYVEQMMLEQGFGSGDDRLRLVQLQEALLRAARMVLDVGVHVDGMSFEDARDYFQRQCYMERVAAEMEAKRLVLNPGTLFIYTYGKLEILALRQEVQAREGQSFSLKRFHDRVLGLGSPPIWAIRREAFGL